MKIEQHIETEPPEHRLQKRLIDISRAINGSIEFGSPQNGAVNVQGFWVNVTTFGADVEFTVNHNLGYIPTGIIVVSADKAAIIYASRKSQWTQTQIFLKCSVTTVSLTGFVI